MLLHTGYLTFTDDSALHKKVCLTIPNLEIRECFSEKINILYSKSNPVWEQKAKKLLHAFLHNEIKVAKKLLSELLRKFISLRDTGGEFFYHGFLQGILAMVVASEDVEMQSEAESGDGYADLTLYHDFLETAVILE